MRVWIIVVVVLCLVALAGGVWFAVTRVTEADDQRTLSVQRQTITQDVIFTGRLAATTSSDVSFELPGTVTQLLVKEGDAVSAGQPLAILDTLSANLELTQAQAVRASTQEKAQLAFEQATAALEQTKATNEKTLAKYRQTVRNAKIDFDQAKRVHEQRAIESGDESVLTETAISSLRAAEGAYASSQTTLTEAVAAAKKNNAAATDVAAAAHAEYLATTQASPRIAGLSSVEVSSALAANKVAKHTLVAPFGGTVTTTYRQIGEAAVAGSPVITVATIEDVELVASATETDAIKVSPSLPATVTFDALPSTQQWTATVTYVAPSATVIEGLSTYTIKLDILGDTSALRTGLTANITIHANKKENVLAIPRRAVITRGPDEFVILRHADQTTVEQKVTTGLIGSDGTVEILEGLTENDIVILNPGDLSREQ